MSSRYFAYGSNLWPSQILSRCPTARVVGPALLHGWKPLFDKPSTDGSAKLNIRPSSGSITQGVVYELDDGDGMALGAFEPGYTRIDVEIDGIATMTYAYEGEPTAALPYDWYLATVLAGARHHGITLAGLDWGSSPDPLAPGVRPATEDDLGLMTAILSEGMALGDDRYYVHPGDLAWWMHHPDPRTVHRVSYWVQNESGLAVIDDAEDAEINVFARPGCAVMPLVRWCQRRLAGRGSLGWVSDRDQDLTGMLEASDYRPGSVFRTYEWDLDSAPIQEPSLPQGWELRALRGEHEAETRRAASHSAFGSTMDPSLHLSRYLRFMRSSVYESDRDLVAVTPEGTVAAFMVWWGDASGIAQIEPFGVSPEFQRRGVGTALIHYGLSRMREAGMQVCRVCTDDDRPATRFYEAAGFEDIGRLRWWALGLPR